MGETLLEDSLQIVFSKESKVEYLRKLSKDLIKLLGLIEDEKNPEKDIASGSAGHFIYGLLVEVNQANNAMFDQSLVKVVLKLSYVNGYVDLPFADVRRQILESKSIVDKLRDKLSLEK